MKKILIEFLCLLIMMQVSVAKLHADEQYPTIMFIAEDSVGNKDSVKIIFHPESTDGLDAELGEVNLYEIPAEKDLDLRIIRRNDTLWWFPLNVPETKREPYWLHSNCNDDKNYGGYGDPACVDYDVYVRTAPNNFDFKTEYLPNKLTYFCQSGISLKLVNVKYYPITIEHKEIKIFSSPYQFNILAFAIFDNDYNLKSQIFAPGDFSTFKFEIKEPAENYIFVFHFGRHAGIKEENIKLLHPNPGIDFVVLEDCDNYSEYAIISNTGTVVKTGVIDNTECIIDISELHTSIYYIKTKNNFYKLIKMEN